MTRHDAVRRRGRRGSRRPGPGAPGGASAGARSGLAGLPLSCRGLGISRFDEAELRANGVPDSLLADPA
ncbi:hypothetical protein, partial [Streptomyces bohaiensis]|uniref:hypothetical protein n=1 Tax=Streptomyces bohaiensis TaxID=1431344 RepID=UPI001ADDB823